MPITLINPDGLRSVDLYHQVAVASGSRMVFLAGQVSVDTDGAVIGTGDLAAQVEQCFRNVATALAAADATFADVAKLTVYLVDWTPDKMGALAAGIYRASAALGISAPPPLTGVGVAALAGPELLVEVEATAVVG
jgi:enamine deaminase RidA (YjgF/YER057c/UK114 family)